MSMEVNLELLVQNCMNDLITNNGLEVVEISGNEVLLKSDAYSIDVVADRDGVSMVYFDTSVNPIKGYNIFLYLVNKRRNLLTFSSGVPQAGSYAEFVEKEVASLAKHLRSAGQDILAGSRDWIESYSWPTVTPSGDIAALI